MPVPLAITQSSTGLEIIERQAWRQLIERLDQELNNQQSAWAPFDREDAEAADKAYVPIELEKLHKGSYLRGARPSIMRLPVEFYPALAVMADTVRPDPSSELYDSQHVFRDMIYVEAIVRSQLHDPNDATAAVEVEGNLNLRTKRTGEAIIQALFREPTLGGVANLAGFAPSLTISDPDTLKSVQPKTSGETWLFQFVRVDITLRKHSELPEIEELDPQDFVRGFGG